MTTAKNRAPLREISNAPPKISTNPDDNMTVEEYLQKKLNEMIKDFTKHSQSLQDKLRDEYKLGADAIRMEMARSSAAEVTTICITIKCIAGSHLGQKFRLEPETESGDDEFKIGRSTGRLFKEKGLSLYKDKEISTTHAKIETRGGHVYLVDMKSTNGTLLNNEEIAPLVAQHLKNKDVICVGNTELLVEITELLGGTGSSLDSMGEDDEENMGSTIESY